MLYTVLVWPLILCEQSLNYRSASSAVLPLLVQQMTILYHSYCVIYLSPLLLHCMLGSSSSPDQMLTVCPASFAQLSLVHAGGRCDVFHPARRPVVHVFFSVFLRTGTTAAAPKRTTPFLAS